MEFYQEKVRKWRASNTFAIVIVCGALFIDSVLVSIIVPIMPAFMHSMGYSLIVDSSQADLTSSRPANVSSAELSSSESQIKHDDLLSEGTAYGLIVAGKPVAQLITNMFAGPLADKIGNEVPFTAGFIIVIVATAVLVYGQSLAVLITARVIQGIGSSFLAVAGLATLASRYLDDNERGKAMTFALGGLTFGLLTAAPFGEVVYQLTNKSTPFLIVCDITVFFGCLRLLMVQSDDIVEVKAENPSSLLTLLMDPYISLTAFALLVGNIAFSFLEFGLPIWMTDTMESNSFQIGIAFLPSFLAYTAGLIFYPPMSVKFGRWLVALLAYILLGALLVIIPFCRNLAEVILPMAMLGIGFGMAQTSLLPELAHLVDLRHATKYATVYAIGDIAQGLARGFGPAVIGILLKTYNFANLSFGIAVMYFVLAPILVFLKNPASFIYDVNS